MSNYKDAAAFEETVATILGEHGFWATVIPKGKDGSQPADIIAVNHKGVHLIDAKLCKGGRFDFSRMEDNQNTSMDLISERAGGRGWFALGYPGDKIYIVEKFKLCMLRDSGASGIGNKIPDSLRIEVWVREHSDL